MPGRRSISVEPENMAVASPRRSSRIRTIHQDSPAPAEPLQELPMKRTRRSSSIQEKSLSDIKDDLKKTQDVVEKPKTPARRTRRSISAQEEQKPVVKEMSVKLTKVEIKEIPEDEEKEAQTPPMEPLEEVTASGRPKRRVTRSMSKSPVSLKNAAAAATTAAPVTRSRRLSLNDKQNTDTKVPTLDIIAETEAEVEKTEETSETDVLNNNNKKKQMDEENEKNGEVQVEKNENVEKTEDKTMDVPGDTMKEEKIELDTSVKSVTTPRRSPRVKAAKESPVLNTSIKETKEDTNEEKILNVSIEKIDVMEKMVNELIYKETEDTEDKKENGESPNKQVEKQNNEEIQDNDEPKLQDNQEPKIQDNEEPKIQDNEEPEIQNNEKPEIKDTVPQTKNNEEIKKPLNEEDADRLNESNISIVQTSLNSSKEKKDIDEINKKLLEDDERPQNISLVNDDGRSYSPIIPVKTDISLRLNDSRKSLNSTNISQKLDTSEIMEPLQMSLRDEEDAKIVDETAKDISVDLDATKFSNKSTPIKSVVNVNDSVVSVKSLNKTSDDKENTDMNVSNILDKSSASGKKDKRASKIHYREQILNDYIASFTAEKKRKRESLNTSEIEESAEKKKRRSGSMSAKTVSSCNFSEDEDEYENEEETKNKNEFLDDEASEGTEDTPSIGSNDIIDEGESIGSTNSEHDSNDTYENDSFVVDDDEVEDEELLSGTEEFLGNMRMPKRKRVQKMASDSDSDLESTKEENDSKLDKMSMEPFGGSSPTEMSEKQISSVDSDLESVKNRNEELSQQIEDGTLIPEVEPKRFMDESESEEDEDVMIVEDAKVEEQNETEVKDESINESTPKVEVEEKQQEEEDKEAKYQKLIKKYFDVTSKNRSRRETIGETTIVKTPKKQSRKRNTSLNIEINENTNTAIEDEPEENQNETQVIEVNLGLKENQEDDANDSEESTKYEFNNSGVFKVSPGITNQEEDKVEQENKLENESLIMLRDFNDSLNDSLDLITFKSQNKKRKLTPIKNETPIKENVTETSNKENVTETPIKENVTETPTSLSKKKRKKNKSLDTSTNSTEPEEIQEKPIEKKKRKSIDYESSKTETEIETTENEPEPKLSKNKKRKMQQDEKKNKKSVTESESDVANSSFQTTSSNDSQKENKNNKKSKKNKSPIAFNFKAEKCKISASKSEIEYDNYAPPKYRNVYKNLFKPSSSGFTGTSQFIIKELVSKVSHGIKKQKYKNNTNLNTKNITSMMNNCSNWKVTLLTDGNVKAATNFRKNKKNH